MTYTYEDKNVLVTGGVGTIGTAIVDQLLKEKPRSIRILDIDENRLFEYGQSQNSVKIRTFIGDIRDKERLKRAIKGTNVVFHAAALKHVPLCEYNPFEAVKTNVIGTQNLIEVAIDESIDKFITISTDKAVNPINVMGATKLLAERLTIAANTYKGGINETKFSCCRFGNVLNSRGSVVPLFVNQIRTQKKIIITDKLMTRFMMTLENAIELVLNVGRISNGGEIYILKMPVLKITDLADVIIEKVSKKYQIDSDEIQVEYIGKRPGEKLYENLITLEEYASGYESDNMYIILPQNDHPNYKNIKIPANFRKVKTSPLSSDKEVCLTREEIYDLLKNIEI
jgi:UDP-N-acetylglucosamine 4,6-dehydratase/5-epimerase